MASTKPPAPLTLYVLDSTVFAEGYGHLFVGKPCVTTYHVLEEAKSGRAALEAGRLLKAGLEVLKPSASSVEKVLALREKTKDKMSQADISIVALALDFKAKGKEIVVVSDDYAVQNLCAQLSLKWLPVTATGITKKFVWQRICPACGKATEEETCPVCGSTTRFVPREV